jgi:type VI secretion system protein ImpK
MADEAANGYWLLDAFTDFYQDLALVKAAAAGGRLTQLLGVEKGGAPINAEDLAATVQMRLKSHLDRQSKEMTADATEYERRAYLLALYLMASLADEILLELDWPGRDCWRRYLLEQALCGSAMAGQRVFVLMDQVLRTRNRSPLNQDLASVFLITLQLGFRGECQGQSGQERLDAYRRKLLAFVDAGYVDRAGMPMFPQAYTHTVSIAVEQRLRSYTRWYQVGLWLMFGYLALSSAVWLGSMHRLADTLYDSSVAALRADATHAEAGK